MNRIADKPARTGGLNVNKELSSQPNQSGGTMPFAMSPITYYCPSTGSRVRTDAAVRTSDGVYEVVTCMMCGQVHLVDTATGKVLSENKERPEKAAL
jgi:hypothetical protein